MTEIGHMTSNLLMLLLCMGGLAFAARRFLPSLRAQPRPGSPLAHICTLALTPQCSVALVRAGQEDLLLGLTAQSMTLLAKTPPTPPPPLVHREMQMDFLDPVQLRALRKLPPKQRRPMQTCQLSFFPKRRG